MAPRRRWRSRSRVAVIMRALLVVVGGTADVVMGRRRRGPGVVDQQGLAIQPVLEHGVDMAIRAGAGDDGRARRPHSAARGRTASRGATSRDRSDSPAPGAAGSRESAGPRLRSPRRSSRPTGAIARDSTPVRPMRLGHVLGRPSCAGPARRCGRAARRACPAERSRRWSPRGARRAPRESADAGPSSSGDRPRRGSRY